MQSTSYVHIQVNVDIHDRRGASPPPSHHHPDAAKDIHMIIADFQASLDKLAAVPAAIAAEVAAAAAGASLPPGAASAQDVADTVAALQPLVDALPQPAPAPPTPDNAG